MVERFEFLAEAAERAGPDANLTTAGLQGKHTATKTRDLDSDLEK